MLSLTLTDDLNHPLPGESLSVYIKRDERSLRFDAQTDAFGHALIQTDLPDGVYLGSAAFMGREGLLPATIEFQFDVKKCLSQTSLIPHQSGAFSIDDPIILTLQREKNICTNLDKSYLLEIDEWTSEHELFSGQTESQIDIPPYALSLGAHEIQLTSPTNAYFAAENISVPLYIYDTLFEKQASLDEDWRGIHLVVSLSPHLPNAFANAISAELQWMPVPPEVSAHDDLLSIAAHLPDFISIKRYHLEATSNAQRELTFDIPLTERSDAQPSCIFAQIGRINGSENDRIVQTLCLPPKRPFSQPILWIIGIAAFLSVTYGLYIKFYPLLKRKYQNRPKAPKTQHAAPEIIQNTDDIDVVLPSSCPSNHWTCLPIDEKTGQIIRSPLIAYTHHKKTSTASFPLSLPLHTTIELSHPDYMTWQGKIHHPGNYKIKLKSKRDYIIDCYRYVCRQYIDGDDTWGKISPKMLYQQTENHPKCQNPEARTRLNHFCQSFDALAFGAHAIDEDDLNHIYQQSRRI